MAEAEEENKKINKSEEKINDTKKKSIKSSQQLKQLASDIVWFCYKYQKKKYLITPSLIF